MNLMGHTLKGFGTLKTLATTSSSRPNPKALVAREVLAHKRTMFHTCTCGFCRGVAVVVAALIGYDDMEVATEMTTRRR
jgi:hypothetical protein